MKPRRRAAGRLDLGPATATRQTVHGRLPDVLLLVLIPGIASPIVPTPDAGRCGDNTAPAGAEKYARYAPFGAPPARSLNAEPRQKVRQSRPAVEQRLRCLDDVLGEAFTLACSIYG